jgi:hypothetical protein
MCVFNFPLSLLCFAKWSQSLKLALAYYAYALDNPVQCLSYLGQVRDLANAQVRLDAMGSLRSSSSSLNTRSASDNTSSVSFIGSFVSSESTPMIADIADGRAWAAIEVVRSVCLQGDLRPSLCCQFVNIRCVKAWHSKRFRRPIRPQFYLSTSVPHRHSRPSKATFHCPFHAIHYTRQVQTLSKSSTRLLRNTVNFGDG